MSMVLKPISFLQSSVLVVLNITDSNDHVPKLSQPSYNVTIEENYVGPLTSLVISATDKDSGRNGRVTYSIVGGSSLFVIDATTVGILKCFVSI